MTHAADVTGVLNYVPDPKGEPTIADKEIQTNVNYLDDRYDLTKREVSVIDSILRTAAKRIDQPLV